jgi:hypothetical protein
MRDVHQNKPRLDVAEENAASMNVLERIQRKLCPVNSLLKKNAKNPLSTDAKSTILQMDVNKSRAARFLLLVAKKLNWNARNTNQENVQPRLSPNARN